MAYDRGAWLARWNALCEAERIEAAARHVEYDRQRNATRVAAGHPLARQATTTAAMPASPSPPPPTPIPIVASPPTAAEREFERVRAAGCARIDAERIAHRAQEAAVTMILDAYAAFEPADRTTLRAPQRGRHAGEEAVALILSFIPKQRF